MIPWSQGLLKKTAYGLFADELRITRGAKHFYLSSEKLVRSSQKFDLLTNLKFEPAKIILLRIFEIFSKITLTYQIAVPVRQFILDKFVAWYALN
mgnify:CR=1 FL=1